MLGFTLKEINISSAVSEILWYRQTDILLLLQREKKLCINMFKPQRAYSIFNNLHLYIKMYIDMVFLQ